MKRGSTYLLAMLASSVAVGCGAHREPASSPLVRTTSAALPEPILPLPEEPPLVIGPPPRDAERVIAGLRPKFRACYERGRTEDHPHMKGKVLLVTQIAEDGSVTSAEVARRDGLSVRVAECIASQMTRATFARRATPLKFEVPVRFVDAGR